MKTLFVIMIFGTSSAFAVESEYERGYRVGYSSGYEDGKNTNKPPEKSEESTWICTLKKPYGGNKYTGTGPSLKAALAQIAAQMGLDEYSKYLDYRSCAKF